MDKESFEKYKQDNQIVKFGEWQGGHFLHHGTKTIVFFAFFHKGLPNRTHGDFEKRILFDMYDLKSYQGPLPLTEIKSEQYILVNADYPDYAMLFKIFIDEQTDTAKLTVEEYPQLGISIITEEERKGIEVKLKITQ